VEDDQATSFKDDGQNDHLAHDGAPLDDYIWSSWHQKGSLCEEFARL
jgi:hypothetical protein